MNGSDFDYNSGIRATCYLCGDKGFVYHNASLERDIEMCDACRDDIDRRKQFADRITSIYQEQ